MAWLDRERMPVRFTLATSVTSGLTVATILKVFSSGIAGSALLMWFALTMGGAALVAGAAAALIHRRRPRRVFFMTSAFIQKYHVASFVQRLHRLLDRDGIDLVLKVPDRDYDANAQSHHLRRILSRRRDYTGGIIFAAEAHRFHDDLIAFCQNFGRPVVFTDVEPFDEDKYPKNAAFIGYDTGELGELAGQWLVKHLQGTDRPRVLIVASHEHAARQQRCQQVLRSALPDVHITVNEGCAFIRARAHDAVYAHVRQLAPGQHLDAIFCTNDEMALGAVDALSTPSPVTRPTVVVGVDGVAEAKALIGTRTSPLRATVVQDTHRLAGSVVDLLHKMHRGHPFPKRTRLAAEIHETT